MEKQIGWCNALDNWGSSVVECACTHVLCGGEIGVHGVKMNFKVINCF